MSDIYNTGSMTSLLATSINEVWPLLVNLSEKGVASMLVSPHCDLYTVLLGIGAKKLKLNLDHLRQFKRRSTLFVFLFVFFKYIFFYFLFFDFSLPFQHVCNAVREPLGI